MNMNDRKLWEIGRAKRRLHELLPTYPELLASLDLTIGMEVDLKITCRLYDHPKSKQMTVLQRNALYGKWIEDAQGLNLADFIDTATVPHQDSVLDGCVMVPWCGMTVGIERDGYTHT